MSPAGHLVVGLAFVAAKAFLVALIVMHLIRRQARTRLAAGLGLFWPEPSFFLHTFFS